MDILETAKQLVEDTKRLVSSAAGSQEQLASAAQKAVKTITNEVRYIVLERYVNVSSERDSNTSLIRTPMGQKKVSLLVRCPHFRG